MEKTNIELYNTAYENAVETAKEIFNRHGFSEIVTFSNSIKRCNESVMNSPDEIPFDIIKAETAGLYSPAVIGRYTGNRCTDIDIYFNKNIPIIRLSHPDKKEDESSAQIIRFISKVLSDNEFKKDMTETLCPVFENLKKLFLIRYS